MDISTACSGSVKGMLPTPVAMNFGLKGIAFFLLFYININKKD
jgi:hypothetical protein